jgi:DNA repair protein SbcC/Rad50
MVLKRIKLNNYRRFRSLELEFPENLIGIVGKNGVGKSSLLEAVGWALYGTRIVRTDKQDMRTQSMADNSVCSVELDFSYGGQDYRIVRKIKGKNAAVEASLSRAGAADPEAVQERGVNEYINNLLKLDYQSFLVSVFARQKELAALSSMQPEERRRSLVRLIGIDAIDAARERVRQDRKEQSKYLDGLRAGLEDITVLEGRSRELNEKLSAQEQDVTRLETALQQKRDDLAKSKTQFEALSQLRDRYHALETRLARIQSQIQEAEKTCEKRRQEQPIIEQAEQEWQALQPTLAELESIRTTLTEWDQKALQHTRKEALAQNLAQVQKLLTDKEQRERELTATVEQNHELEVKLVDIEKRVADLELDGDELRALLTQCSGQLDSAKRNGLEWTEKLQNLKKLGPQGKCPTCTQSLQGHFQEAIAEIEDKIQTLREEYKEQKNRETTVQKQLQDWDKNYRAGRQEKENVIKGLAGLQQVGKQLQALRQEKQSLQANVNDTKQQWQTVAAIEYDPVKHQQLQQRFKEIQKLEQKAGQLQERIARKASLAEEILQLQSMLETLRTSLRDLVSDQNALHFQEEVYLATKKEIENHGRVVEQAQSELMRAREGAAACRQDLQTAQEAITANRQKRTQIDSLLESTHYLELLDVHFSRFRLELAGRIRPLLAHRASDLLAMTSSGRYQHMELDEDYNIHVYDGNKRFAIDRFSGGEQDLVNLCLRIAISQIVADRRGGAPINFIVLDEVFASQDEDRKQLILSALARLSTQFRQMFMITHVEAIRDALPVILHIHYADEHLSEAEWN